MHSEKSMVVQAMFYWLGHAVPSSVAQMIATTVKLRGCRERPSTQLIRERPLLAFFPLRRKPFTMAGDYLIHSWANLVRPQGVSTRRWAWPVVTAGGLSSGGFCQGYLTLSLWAVKP